MSVTYKRVFRKNPALKDGTGKYHPQLIVWGKSATLDTLAQQMKESSSLTLGDIRSVLTNFVAAMRAELYNGHSVNVDGFGVFSLSATTEGVDRKEDCGGTRSSPCASTSAPRAPSVPTWIPPPPVWRTASTSSTWSRS